MSLHLDRVQMPSSYRDDAAINRIEQPVPKHGWSPCLEQGKIPSVGARDGASTVLSMRLNIGKKRPWHASMDPGFRGASP